jgi:hypothetical protein
MTLWQPELPLQPHRAQAAYLCCCCCCCCYRCCWRACRRCRCCCFRVRTESANSDAAAQQLPSSGFSAARACASATWQATVLLLPACFHRDSRLASKHLIAIKCTHLSRRIIFRIRNHDAACPFKLPVRLPRSLPSSLRPLSLLALSSSLFFSCS